MSRRIFHKMFTVIVVAICYLIGIMVTLLFLEPIIVEWSDSIGKLILLIFGVTFMLGSSIVALVFS